MLEDFPKRAVMVTTTRFNLFVTIGLCLTLGLAGCGRKAGLETPGAPEPVAEGPVDPAIAATTATESETATETRRFFLDPLIGANKPSDLESSTE